MADDHLCERLKRRTSEREGETKMGSLAIKKWGGLHSKLNCGLQTLEFEFHSIYQISVADLPKTFLRLKLCYISGLKKESTYTARDEGRDGCRLVVGGRCVPLSPPTYRLPVLHDFGRVV